MKLILHVGTHKTASTSIQHFCALNRTILQQHGYHYPRNNDSAYVANYLASRLAHGKGEEVADFLARAAVDAAGKGCHTVLISAESFYAMTGFFNVHGKNLPGHDYWSCEEALITRLRDYCADYDEIEIVCYFRPQDDLAASLYNQFVKNVYGISESYESFVERMKDVFDYERHMALWAKAFGTEALRLKNFEVSKTRIVEDFCEGFLTPDCFAQAEKKAFRSNIRLCRDVLEFKKEHNKLPRDRALAFIIVRCFHQMAEDYEDKPGYQIFAPIAFREKFFAPFQTGNDKLAQFYDIASLDVLSDAQTEPSYPGLGDGRRQAIATRLQSLLDSPKNRMELAIRRGANALMTRSALADKILDVFRMIRNQLRLRLEGW